MKKITKICFAFSLMIIVFSLVQISFFNDRTINIIEGKETEVSLNFFSNSIILRQNNPKISVNGVLSDEYKVKNAKKMIFLSETEGIFKISVNMYSVIPLGSVTVNVIPESKVYVGGDAIGVKLKTDGVIAVGFENIQIGAESFCPARECGIMTGDVIKMIGDVKINTAEEFRKELTKLKGEQIMLTLVRGNNEQSITVVPVYEAVSGNYLIGLWVRDNIAGIGTLSCISADLTRYAALGHSISDTTTGIKVPVSEGELVKAEVLRVVKGTRSTPGELKAVIDSDSGILGDVRINDEYGIYGSYCGEVPNGELMMYATQDEIVEGPATIITSIDGERKEYAAEIIKIRRQNKRDSKGMTIRIVDRELLDKTGGIIQGMSGSPIIQNSKVVGAVTHVLLNDPTTGYAIFIEWMIKDMYSCQISTNSLQ